jgi:hypothetical protein
LGEGWGEGHQCGLTMIYKKVYGSEIRYCLRDKKLKLIQVKKQIKPYLSCFFRSDDEKNIYHPDFISVIPQFCPFTKYEPGGEMESSEAQKFGYRLLSINRI